MADPLHIAALMAQALPAPDARDWRRQMEQAIAKGHLAAYLTGASERLRVPVGGALLNERNLSRAERAEVRAAIARQLRYLDGFDPSTMTPAAARARAEMYARATRETYSRARWFGYELPFHPCEGTDCLTNCLCSWRVDDAAGVAYWQLGDAEHCDTCSTRASGSPYPIRRET